MLAIGQKEGNAVFSVRAQPRSSRSALVGLYGTALKVSLKAAPVDDAANVECCRFFARLFAIPAGSVHLLAGKSSRTKLLMLEGVSVEQAETRFGELLPPS